MSGKLMTEVSSTGSAQQYEQGGQMVTFVPLQVKRRQTRCLLVPPPGEASASLTTSFDQSLIRTVGKAFYWQKLMDSTEGLTMTELAKQLKLEVAWVAEAMRMTRLAPDILAAIVEGKQPRYLNLQAVRRGIPLDWQEQRQVLGFVAADGLGGGVSENEK